MLQWLRKTFGIGMKGKGAMATSTVPTYGRQLLSELYVQPNGLPDDFDRDSCERLLHRIVELGAKYLGEESKIVVSLEEFFDGNRSKHSIAANVLPPAPYNTSAAWYEHLKKVRATAGVESVVVGICQIEPYEDGRIGTWPYSDTVWIYSSLDLDTISQLVAPLEPDEVHDASIPDPNWELRPPHPARGRVRPYWVWWD